MNLTVLAINATFGKRASEKEEGLENKCKAAMKAVIRENWMSTSDDEMFRSAIAGVFQDVGNDSKHGEVLLNSLNALKSFSAFLAACQSGLHCEPPEIEGELLPLMSWWNAAKE